MTKFVKRQMLQPVLSVVGFLVSRMENVTSNLPDFLELCHTIKKNLTNGDGTSVARQ